LDVFVDLVLNDRAKHGPILHISVHLKRLVYQINDNPGFRQVLGFGN
jgi:hypothetical protein